MSTIGPAPFPTPVYAKTTIDTFVLFIPLITAILTAITTFITMLIKEKRFQKTKDKNDFIGQRLQNCYTPLHLKLQTRKDFSLGFLKAEINEIVVKYGHLLDVPLLHEYINIYDAEIQGLQVLELNQKIHKNIDDEKYKMESLDKDSPMYDKYYTLYMDNWDKLLKQSQQVIDIYKEIEKKYIEGVKNFRNSLDIGYKNLISEYFKYFKTDVILKDSDKDSGQTL